jgi:hypothetical protein
LLRAPCVAIIPAVPPDAVGSRSIEETLALLPPAMLDRPERSLRPTLDRPATSTSQAPPDVSELPPISIDDAAEASDLSVLRTLGEGGMGRVVLAAQRSLRRQVAVKTAHASAETNLAIVHEGVVTGMLEHPNIPAIHGLNRDAEGRAVLVMKKIDGVTWSEVLADPEHPIRGESPLFSSHDDRAHLEVLLQICNALELAHSRGVIHRDIKPSNVMVGRFGEVYLIDWGIAFHASWHPADAPISVMGTPLYMAPEMIRCQRPDERTDVYLLGGTLHEILTGHPPHKASSVRAAMMHSLDSPPPEYGPEVPVDLAELCRRSMARDRDDRPANVAEFRAALRDHLSHRASNNLAKEASKRFEELRDLLRDPAPDPTALAKLEHECRFGFAQALREWPGNEAAREGMSGACRVLAAHEIAAGNARGARQLLAEIGGPEPELEAALEELVRRDRERERAEEERLAHERQMDLRTSRREHLALTLVIGLMVVGLTARELLWPEQTSDAARQQLMLARIWVGTIVVVAVTIAILRKRLLTTVANRRWILIFMTSLVAMGINRASGLALDAGHAVTLAGDMLVLSATFCTASIAFVRSLVWLVPVGALSVALISAWPAHSGNIFNVSLLALIVLFLIVIRRVKRANDRVVNER